MRSETHVQPTQKEWLEESEAMGILKRSRATLRRLAASGTIKTELQRLDGRQRDQTMYHAGDVEHLRSKPDEIAAGAKLQSNLPAVRPRAELVPGQQHRNGPPPLPAMAPGLFMTLPEAAEYSRLPVGCIEALIDDGVLRVVPHTRPRMIARSALDAYADSFKLGQ